MSIISHLDGNVLYLFSEVIEDSSGEKAMEILLPQLLGDSSTYNIHSYKGIGRLPRNLQSVNDPRKRILLDQLPRLLRGYGKASLPDTVVVIICDLDNRDKLQFLSELNSLLNTCNPKPEAVFCLAIEEFEAWYLGDLVALRKAYPNVKNNVLSSYRQDDVCGTWELLANAVYKGGVSALEKKGWMAVGEQKSIWADKISPYMDVDRNNSPSFCHMRDTLRSLAAI